ncbi:hypothetical protein GLAREA_02192 [Glarea lozoyensis ATCC 20868]|uniref:Uncharacterized protein n=1 Tax=Glarea lozoyensis (strain ATCC 20868 / MF5171) TaxID=1116229 RepID=S3CKM9_GLAL2|nr:uncharacterized protein GLAREA_02192 [Glarea lozoyensis ATCC 20868]EPE26280.1 hypothetical protein GLAREA_02192 [Glarea lozoyensis ATCC 20868]
MAGPAKSITTESGTITAWLPILTPYASIAACSSQIYRIASDIIAYDPYFPIGMGVTGLHCLPEELSLSWWQRDTETTTVLGPTFMCPEAYSAVSTVSFPSSIQTLCCPSSYQLTVSIIGLTFASQCTSKFTPGETIFYNEYQPSSNTWQRTSSVVAASASPSFAYGFHMNGFNFVPATSTSSSITGSTATSTTQPSNAIMPTTTSSSSNMTAAIQETATPSKKTSAGAIAGGVIGAVAIVSLLTIIGFWLLRKRKSKPQHSESFPKSFQSTSEGKVEQTSSPMHTPQPIAVVAKQPKERRPTYELPLTAPTSVHEMSADREYEK